MKTVAYSEEEILKGIKSQDEKVLLFIYRNNFRSVKHYIENNNGSDKDAEDIFQEAMIVIFTKIQQGNLVLKCSVHTYLFSVAKILWLKQLEFAKIKNLSLDECENFISENEDILESITQTERKSIFIKHFNELTKDCQKIIASFLKGISITEITKVMGYSSEQHTKNRRFRCKKTLIEKILLNPHYKELTNGTIGKNNQVPRW